MSDQVESDNSLVCGNVDCTLRETGICVLGYANFKTDCPEYIGEPFEQETDTLSNETDVTESTIQPFDENGRRFWSGQELGYVEAKDIMSSSPTHLIGLVGLSDVGKTCYLSSLFLKACSSDLPLKHFRFAGSQTLCGFEARVSYTRDWDQGQLPKVLSERTKINDLRQAGFMHLSLDTIHDPPERYEILLTDFPGEWFDWLIDDQIGAERLDILTRADGILFFVDAGRLESNQTRHLEIQRARLLLGRLVEDVGIPTTIPLVFVVSKIDMVEHPLNIEKISINDLIGTAVDYGFNPITLNIASFSSKPSLIDNGFNVEEALLNVLNSSLARPDFPIIMSQLERSFARYGWRMKRENNE